MAVQAGLENGIPVAVAMNAEMTFMLAVGRGEWSLSRALFDAPAGTARPVLIAAQYPATYEPSGSDGSVVISFDVDPKGTTANLHVEHSSNSALESEVIGIVRSWRFQPGVKGSDRVSVRCTLEFVKQDGNMHP